MSKFKLKKKIKKLTDWKFHLSWIAAAMRSGSNQLMDCY